MHCRLGADISAGTRSVIEDNWLAGQRIGQGSFDELANPIVQMFDFKAPHARRLFLDPSTGEPKAGD